MKHTHSLKLLAAVLLAIAFNNASARAQEPQQVTLAGQIVCSVCWFEADRETTAYGTAADLKCAADCFQKGIPPALAVKDNDEFKLYVIQPGKFKASAEEWLAYVGKFVRVAGEVSRKGDHEYLAINNLSVSTAAAKDAGVQGRMADLMLKDLVGIEQKISGFQGRIVILNFWATWCIPCRTEMPELVALQNDYAAFGVQVIGASANLLSERPQVEKFVKEARINFPVWLGATTEDLARFGLGPALPGTVIIGRDGRIISVTNALVTRASLSKQIETLLATDAKGLDTIAAVSQPPKGSLVPS